MRIDQLVPAESGWKAVFTEPDGGETMSRVLGWAAIGNGDEVELAGIIVDPGEPSRIVSAVGAVSPGGGSFARYRYVPPEPMKIVLPEPKPAASEDTAEQLAKGLLKRRR